MTEQELRKQIGENIKYFRELNNLSKVELAKKISSILGREIDSTYFTPWEQGKYSPNKQAQNAICQALNITIDELIYGTKAENIDSMEETAEKILKGVRIPVLGSIRAGIPNSAIEDIIDYEEITEDMAKHGKHFALKIKGDSMSPNLLEDDVVIFRECENAETGDVCAILVNGDDATVKKIKKTEQGLYLIPYNTAHYEPIFYTNEEIETKPVRVIGKAIEVRRSLWARL